VSRAVSDRRRKWTRDLDTVWRRRPDPVSVVVAFQPVVAGIQPIAYVALVYDVTSGLNSNNTAEHTGVVDSWRMMTIDAIARRWIIVPATTDPAADCTPTGRVQAKSRNAAEPGKLAGTISIKFVVLYSQSRMHTGHVQSRARDHCKRLQQTSAFDYIIQIGS